MRQVESEQLLRDCRELLTNRMRTSMSRMMADVEDVLFEKATGGETPEQSSLYIDGVREIRMKKREIQVRFENRFHDLFDHSVREIKKGNQVNIFAATNPNVARVINIKQAGADLFEHRIEKVRAECRSALVQLDKHVSELLLNVPVDNFHNPMQPATVFNAFQESCGDIQVGSDIRQLLADMFDKHMGSALQCVYKDLNTLLQSYPQARPELVDTGATGSTHLEQGAEQPTRQSSLLVGNWVADTILAQIKDYDIPDFIREFLLSTWGLVLEMTYEKKGDASQEWYRVMQVMTDLVVCSRLTGDKDGRRQQIWMLPGLIYRLKAGMKSVAVPLKQQADFFSQLKAHHARITESGMAAGRTV